MAGGADLDRRPRHCRQGTDFGGSQRRTGLPLLSVGLSSTVSGRLYCSRPWNSENAVSCTSGHVLVHKYATLFCVRAWKQCGHLVIGDSLHSVLGSKRRAPHE